MCRQIIENFCSVLDLTYTYIRVLHIIVLYVIKHPVYKEYIRALVR